MAEMTETQGRYLAFIQSYIDGFGLSPAESEIAAAIGVSPPSVNQMLKTLEKKGFIQRQPGVARSIEILVDEEDIPRWKGKRITRTVKMWIRDDRAVPKSKQSGGSEATVYTFKITLKYTKPSIWRRIETFDVSLGELHELIQTAMGWTNSHLHQFTVGKVRYTDMTGLPPEGFGALDYRGIRIRHLVPKEGAKLRMEYEYDFGDCWQHQIVLEKMTPAEPRARYPRCIAGERSCPPEDVGGVWGFSEFVEAITDPEHGDYEERLQWYGAFDPEEFDPKVATRRMRKGLPKW